MGKLFPRLIGLFSKIEGGKHQVDSEAEVGNEYKRRERTKWKGPLEGHVSGLKRTFTDSAWMLSLVSFLRFVEEVRNRPWLHSIL